MGERKVALDHPLFIQHSHSASNVSLTSVMTPRKEFFVIAFVVVFDMFVQCIFATLSDIDIYSPTGDIDAAKHLSQKLERAIKKGTVDGSRDQGTK